MSLANCLENLSGQPWSHHCLLFGGQGCRYLFKYALSDYYGVLLESVINIVKEI